MALFKILKGAGNLPTTKNEGWAYVKKTGSDTANFYVDYDANTRVQIGKYAENGVYYIDGTGTTAGTWLGSHSGITSYYNGLAILYRPSVAGASTTTLNINGLGAKTCYVKGSTKLTTHYAADSLIILTYDTALNSGAGGWEAHSYYDSNSYCASLCSTSAGTAAKTASHTYYTLRAGNWTLLTMRYSNTYQGKLTLNINSSGAKDLWINGAVSSSSNYTLPAGTYLVYYDGSRYLLYTDNTIPANITGNAATATSATTAGTANKLADAKTFTFTGDVSGSGTFDGSQDVQISLAVADDSHNHIISNVDGLQNALNGKAPLNSPAFTGTPTAPTAAAGTNTTQIATTAFVKTAVNAGFAANDAMIFKGTIGTGGTVTALPASHNRGWTYRVITAGTYAGVKCEIGDLIICLTTGTAANNAHWTVAQTNIDGAVIKNSTASLNGSSKQPVYVDSTSGVVTAIDYTIESSVPPNAKFTDTDTKVTSVGNHYTPAANTNSELTVDASSTTSATWGSTDLVTGVNIQRDAKGHVVGVTVDSIQMPSNPNTDTKVTSVGNHYTPSANTASELTVDASSTTAATWNSTSLVTGVNLQRDAKGHVVGVTVDSIKMPANPNTNTTYTFTSGSTNGAFTVTPSGGSAQSVAIYGLKSAAYKDAASANTASTVVLRDSSGNFSAGTITAALNGNASTASALKGVSSSSVPLSNGGAGYISYAYNIIKDTAGNPPDTSNANGVLTLNTHSGNYYHQLAFSSNNNLYHRAVSGTALTTSTGWNRIMTSNQAIPYIVGPTTDTTAGTWTGTCEDITAYVDGLTIIYVPKVAGASTTTLNINGLGAKTCYYTNSSKLTTHFSVNTPIMLTYIGGTWKRADYDSNTNTQIRVYRQTSGYNGNYPILVSRTALGSIGTAGTDSSYTSVYGVIGQDGAKTPTINPHTGVITAPGGFNGALNGNASTASALTSITTADAASSSTVWRRIWMSYSDNTTGRPAYDDSFAIQTSTGTLKAPIFSGALSGGVKDYNDGTLTKFGYSTSGMAQSAATWLGAWDATVSGEYRLRAVKQADLRVAYATSAGSATKATQDGSGNVITSKYVTLDTTQTISGAKTFSSAIKITKGYTVHSSSGTAGTVGHVKIATLTISSSYQNAPISFKFIRRNDKMPTTISIQFTNANSSDPTLTAFTGYGYNVGAAYLYKSATSTWDLYITKSEGYDTVHIIDFNNSYNSSVAVTWISGTQVDALPTGGTTCSWGGTIATAISATTADKTKAALTLNGKTFNGSTAVDMGVLSPTYGGTGKTTLIDASNALLNALSTGSSTPTDADYYISQYVGGGTTTTTYHRRPMSALWAYIQGKSDSRYVNVSGDTMTGQLTVPGFFYNSGDGTLKIYASTNTTYGTESISIQTAFDAVDGQTHDYVTQYENRCNLLLQPRGGQVYIGVAHTAVGDTTNSLTVGGNAKITNLLTTGSGSTHYGVKVGNTYINAIDGNLIFQNNSAIRFGGDSWDYNVWAGLKYVHSSKTISLGLADGSTFTANAAQSGGTLALPGIRYFSVNGKRVLDAGDTWLRINEGSAFSAGVYFGTSLVRTDGQLQVGSGGSAFYAKSDGTGYFKSNLKVDGKLIMTGNIAYTNGGNQYDVIKFVTGTADGAGLILGGGGVVIIGSGESASNLQGSSGANIAGNTETTYITSDNGIEFYTNCQTIGNRVGVVLNTSRHFYPNVNNTGSLGTTSYKWSTGYFYGSVHAGSVWAAHPTGGEADIGVSFAASKNLYLYGNNSTGARGLYDTNRGSVISVTDSAASFNGNASTASSSPKLTTSGSLTSSNIDSFLEAGVVKWGTGDSTAVGNNDGIVMSFGWSSSYGAQMWLDDGSNEGGMKIRNRNGGTTWNPWRQVLTENNYTNYAAPASHTHAYLPLSGGTISGNVSFSAAASGTSPTAQRISINGVSGDSSVANAPGIGFHTGNVGWASIKCVGSSFYFYDNTCTNYVPIYGSKVYGAVWNDYAEYRTGEITEAGRVSYCDNDGKLKITSIRLQKFEGVISDTFGFAIGETDNAKTPLAVSGRVLVYTYEPRDTFNSGDCVCAAPNGTVSKMTREEIVTYPDRIVGIVSEIPEYDTWGSGDVKVNGRIWIKVH